MKRLSKTLGRKLNYFSVLKMQRLVEVSDTLNEQEHYIRFRQTANLSRGKPFLHIMSKKIFVHGEAVSVNTTRSLSLR